MPLLLRANDFLLRGLSNAEIEEQKIGYIGRAEDIVFDLPPMSGSDLRLLIDSGLGF